MIDFLGQDVKPGDCVMVSSVGYPMIGIFVKSDSHNVHVQAHYARSVDVYDRLLVQHRDIYDQAAKGGKWYMNPVTYVTTMRKIMKVDPKTLPDNVQELLRVTRELCYMKKKIKYDC